MVVWGVGGGRGVRWLCVGDTGVCGVHVQGVGVCDGGRWGDGRSPRLKAQHSVKNCGYILSKV